MAHSSNSLARTTQMESSTTRAIPMALGSSCTTMAPPFPISLPTTTIPSRLRRPGIQQTAITQDMSMMAQSTPIATMVPLSTSPAKVAAPPTTTSKAIPTTSQPSISSSTSPMEAT
jgi:hypothetical protein